MISLSFGFHCGSSTNCLPQSRHLWFCFPLRVVPFFIMSSDPQVGQLRSSFIQSFLCRDRRSIVLFFSALYKKALPKTFPKFKKVKLFRVIVSTNKTEYVATNDLTQSNTNDVQKVCAIRWKIEELHREIKQLTGIEASSVSQSSDSKKSYCLRFTGMGKA